MEEVSDIAGKRSISVVVKPESLHLSILADKFSIEEMIGNLLSNAVKYSHDGGTVEIIVTDRTDDVLLEIKDSGIGIPSDETEKSSKNFTELRIPEILLRMEAGWDWRLYG